MPKESPVHLGHLNERWDTSFRIHDAGWALIIGFVWLIVLTIIVVGRL